MIDLIYLAHGREEFTRASFGALVAHTNWALVNRLVIYTDGDQSTDWFHHPPHLKHDAPKAVLFITQKLGGPVAIMNSALGAWEHEEIFAKIDNDVIVPPGWLDRCVEVMEAFPELQLLGIEPPRSRTPSRAGGRRMACPEIDGPGPIARKGRGAYLAPGIWETEEYIGYGITDSIGGIGLMRRAAWGSERMEVSGFRGVGGFTSWQRDRPHITKGWIAPPLELFLLDRLPIEPWKSLSDRYIAEGLQRPWTNYDPADASLWEWWTRAARA